MRITTGFQRSTIDRSRLNTLLACAEPALAGGDGELLRRLGKWLVERNLGGNRCVERLLECGLADSDENNGRGGKGPGYDWGGPENLGAEAEQDQPAKRPKQAE